ncbi:unnamed protein product [Polarella glacialis]|uniref:NYN domain-containing protein n=1 Tax=Polarella glacialis TaxID=89957 RepID=A0A813D772_POLGL|nr:unnamed protein product [Polarella glacialis]
MYVFNIAQRTGAGWDIHRDRWDLDTANLLPTFHADGTPKYATVWIALSEATPLNSCIYCLPKGSDRLYFGPDDRADYESPQLHAGVQEIRALPAKPGDVYAWSHRLLHWGSSSTSRASCPRVALSFSVASPQFEKPILVRGPRALPSAWCYVLTSWLCIRVAMAASPKTKGYAMDADATEDPGITQPLLDAQRAAMEKAASTAQKQRGATDDADVHVPETSEDIGDAAPSAEPIAAWRRPESPSVGMACYIRAFECSADGFELAHEQRELESNADATFEKWQHWPIYDSMNSAEDAAFPTELPLLPEDAEFPWMKRFHEAALKKYENARMQLCADKLREELERDSFDFAFDCHIAVCARMVWAERQGQLTRNDGFAMKAAAGAQKVDASAKAVQVDASAKAVQASKGQKVTAPRIALFIDGDQVGKNAFQPILDSSRHLGEIVDRRAYVTEHLAELWAGELARHDIRPVVVRRISGGARSPVDMAIAMDIVELCEQSRSGTLAGVAIASDDLDFLDILEHTRGCGMKAWLCRRATAYHRDLMPEVGVEIIPYGLARSMDQLPKFSTLMSMHLGVAQQHGMVPIHDDLRIEVDKDILIELGSKLSQLGYDTSQRKVNRRILFFMSTGLGP